ncbi:PIG-L family deacetylase [Lunatibacter salilacus]|uniref:PIG-L family deacetylase n=1 Tax=Lunatibacter salilacus TaxID=2483804 RepID=UPI00131B1FE4|nr:PIG-L family deacetylase [Lunatibacter salilacus]
MELVKKLITTYYCIFGFAFFSGTAGAQTSSEIFHGLKKLKETKRVLYLAAHPDDENTRLIGYLANGEHAEVAYLSLTRGDGGQNLIGKELGIELGMIRTQELIRARETDGGRQFFSRAIDFGFSKHPDETLNNWDREKLLADVVWIIRKFQPDIMINRFNDEPGTTHGHHTTSAILSLEAFEKAADPSIFPDQLQWVEPWQAKRVFWNAYNWGGQYEPKDGKLYHRFDVGDLNPLLGRTYSKIAADSRTMHKSQGFGSTAQLGEGNDYMELVKGEAFSKGPFEGVADRWLSVPQGKGIAQAIELAMKNFDFKKPENNVKSLLEIRKKLHGLPSDLAWIKEKQEGIDRLVLQSMGFAAEFISGKELSFPTDESRAKLTLNNSSSSPIELQTFTVLDQSISLQTSLLENRPHTQEVTIKLPGNFPVSQPYWMEQRPEDNLFQIEDRLKIGKPFNDPAVVGKLVFSIQGQKFEREIALKYKYNDQVDGEIIQPFTVVPQASLSINKENVFLLNGESDEIKVEVNFQKELLEGELIFEGIPESAVEILSRIEEVEKKRVIYTVRLSPANGEEKTIIGVQYTTSDGQKFEAGQRRITYKHIPNLTYFPPAEFNLIQLNLQVSPQRIGYIPGAGDDVPGVLANLGYSVTLLDNGSLTLSKMLEFQTIIVGIRAFNVNQVLADEMSQLMAYVEEGGNLIVQYNTSSPLLTRKLGPYPVELSRNRVAVEDSPVKVDFTAHPVLYSPNRIEMTDFDGWVQERGLYFPGNWDDNYTAPLEMQDPNESPTKGSLLLTNYGKGTFTYSGISWFRLLPAGVPGAIKLFVNLIEQAGERKND